MLISLVKIDYLTLYFVHILFMESSFYLLYSKMTADLFAQGLWGQNGYINCHYLISHLVCNHFAQIINAYCLHASFTDSIYELSLKCSSFIAWSHICFKYAQYDMLH